jgi:uncharacterized protein YceK
MRFLANLIAAALLLSGCATERGSITIPKPPPVEYSTP